MIIAIVSFIFGAILGFFSCTLFAGRIKNNCDYESVETKQKILKHIAEKRL